jgi:site-specific recombinase XerD
MDIFEAFRLYLENTPLPARAGTASAKTISGYIQDVSIFLRWSEQSFGQAVTLSSMRQTADQPDQGIFQGFLAWLQSTQGCSANTISRYAASLRAFIRFLCSQGVFRYDRSLELKLPVSHRLPPKGLDARERARFEAVLEIPWQEVTVSERGTSKEAKALVRLARDRALAILMLYAGPRIDEMVQLDLADIELLPQSGTMHIRASKEFKGRLVPLVGPAREALSIWLEARTQLEVPHDALFVELRAGVHLRYRRLSSRSIQIIAAQAGRRAGLGERVTPTLLRHTAAHMLAEAGVSITLRAHILGVSLDTALLYGQARSEDIQRQMARLENFIRKKLD